MLLNLTLITWCIISFILVSPTFSSLLVVLLVIALFPQCGCLCIDRQRVASLLLDLILITSCIFSQMPEGVGKAWHPLQKSGIMSLRRMEELEPVIFTLHVFNVEIYQEFFDPFFRGIYTSCTRPLLQSCWRFGRRSAFE